MIRSVVLPALSVLAVSLVIVGATWKWTHPPESYWSKEQAQSLVDAFGAVHAAEDKAPHGPNDPGGLDFLAARRHYDALQTQLEQARSRRDSTGFWFSATGLALLVAVYLAWQFVPRTTDE